MGIWVVILEAVATKEERKGLGIEPGALDDLAEELAGHYAVVTERPGAYETELWVEEGTAGKAILSAQFLWQQAVRFLGLPAWEVVRAEARDAHALEVGIIDWPEPPASPDEPESLESEPLGLSEPAPRPRRATTKAGTKKAAPGKTAPKRAGATKAGAKKAGAKKATPRKTVTDKTVARKVRNPRR